MTEHIRISEVREALLNAYFEKSTIGNLISSFNLFVGKILLQLHTIKFSNRKI